MKEIYLSIHLFWELQQKALQHIHPNICVADTAPIVKGYNYVMAQKITQMMYDEKKMYDMIHHLSGTCLLPWMSKVTIKPQKLLMTAQFTSMIVSYIMTQKKRRNEIPSSAVGWHRT
jgi:hypothetical protein